MPRGKHLAPKTRTGRLSALTLGLIFGLFLAMAIPTSAAPWTVKVTGGGEFTAGGTDFSVTTSASDVGGQIQYSRPGFSFHATVDCTAVDGDEAVAAGPARGQDGTELAEGAWAKIEVMEGGNNPDRVRVRIFDTGAPECGFSHSYPGVAIDANFNIREK